MCYRGRVTYTKVRRQPGHKTDQVTHHETQKGAKKKCGQNTPLRPTQAIVLLCTGFNTWTTLDQSTQRRGLGTLCACASPTLPCRFPPALYVRPVQRGLASSIGIAPPPHTCRFVDMQEREANSRCKKALLGRNSTNASLPMS